MNWLEMVCSYFLGDRLTTLLTVHHFPADSFVEITNFIQGYVDNEVNINPEGTCWDSCSTYKLTKNYDCKEGTICDANYLDKSKTRCDGAIRDCHFIPGNFNLCPNVRA